MADKNILREYLIKLGWEVDRKPLDDALDSTVRQLGKFTVASIGVGAGVRAISNDLERLYYSSKRTGATAANIRALEYGAEQIGLTSEQARTSLENMSKAWRENPGLRGFLQSLGVKTSGRDRVDVMLDFVTQLRRMPFFIASRQAAMFGIDSDTLLLMEQGLDTMKQARAERLRALGLSGVDMDKEAEAARNLNNELRKMQSEFDTIKVQLFRDFAPALRNTASVLHDVALWIQKADTYTSGWSTRIGAIVAGMGGLTAIGRMLGLVTGGSTGAAVGGVVGAGAAATGAQTYGGYKLGKAAGAGNKPALWALLAMAGIPEFGWLTAAGFYGLMKGNGGPATELGDQGHALGQALRKRLLGGGGGKLPIGLRQNNPGNLRNWGDTPVANGFANFASMEQGLSALAGDLLAKNRQGRNTVASILEKYAPRSENNTDAYIRDVASRMGVGANQHLNLYDMSTLRSLMASIITHEQGYNPFSTDMLNAAAATRLGSVYGGGRGVSLNQKTEIHVHGGGSAADVGRAVADEQNRVNGDLVRNLQGAMR